VKLNTDHKTDTAIMARGWKNDVFVLEERLDVTDDNELSSKL
jgi:hypothetical protein